MSGRVCSRCCVLVFAALGCTAPTRPAQAGPYAPAAEEAGTTALHYSTNLFAAWASGWTNYVVGDECDIEWQTPALALGQAAESSYDIVCLGRGGEITLTFDPPITDGPDIDFAVFENGVIDSFLELAFVEVSSDGTNFARFPSESQTASPVSAFGFVDPTDLTGLASKYRQGFGTPFDLADVPAYAWLDPTSIRWVRIIDIVGDGNQDDTLGHPVYDPYPTLQSAGFDLDAVGVINARLDASTAPPTDMPSLSWHALTNREYQVQWADSLSSTNWADTGGRIPGDDKLHGMSDTNAAMAAGFYRVVEIRP